MENPPVVTLPLLVFHVDVEPDMRVLPLDFRDRAGHLHRLVVSYSAVSDGAPNGWLMTEGAPHNERQNPELDAPSLTSPFDAGTGPDSISRVTTNTTLRLRLKKYYPLAMPCATNVIRPPHLFDARPSGRARHTATVRGRAKPHVRDYGRKSKTMAPNFTVILFQRQHFR